MITSFGVIGAGQVGLALARHAVRAGISTVLSNSRGPNTLTGHAAAAGARAGTVAEAVACDVALLAVPFIAVAGLAEVVPDWSGRIVIDATNHFATSRPYTGRFDLGQETGSEYVARHLPGARVVKAFNTIDVSFIAPDPGHAEGRQLVFYAGDDAAANDTFAQFANRIGFASVLVGGLPEGGRLTQLDGPLSGLAALRQN